MKGFKSESASFREGEEWTAVVLFQPESKDNIHCSSCAHHLLCRWTWKMKWMKVGYTHIYRCTFETNALATLCQQWFPEVNITWDTKRLRQVTGLMSLFDLGHHEFVFQWMTIMQIFLLHHNIKAPFSSWTCCVFSHMTLCEGWSMHVYSVCVCVCVWVCVLVSVCRFS